MANDQKKKQRETRKRAAGTPKTAARKQMVAAVKKAAPSKPPSAVRKRKSNKQAPPRAPMVPPGRAEITEPVPFDGIGGTLVSAAQEQPAHSPATVSVVHQVALEIGSEMRVEAGALQEGAVNLEGTGGLRADPRVVHQAAVLAAVGTVARRLEQIGATLSALRSLPTSHGDNQAPGRTEAVDDFEVFLRLGSTTVRVILEQAQSEHPSQVVVAQTGQCAFARALMDSPDHDGVGMLILVNRKAEAKDMATELRNYRDKLCIYTSDADINELGYHSKADQAQVCVATQAALKATIKGLQDAEFGAAARFHYRGKRRDVVSWDESFSFNRPVTLDADTVGGLARAVRRQSDDAANTLKRWTSDLDIHPGGLCSVPDFEGLGVDFRRLEDDVGDQDTLVTQAKALAVVSGDEGYVTRQGNSSVMITHYPEIPPSLMPVVVTDASAKVNPSYGQMELKIPLVWLTEAPKSYRNMTIRIVPTAASRSVYRDTKTSRGRDLIDMAVRYVESAPGEDVLVIGYKGRFAIRGVDQATIQEAIEARLKPADRRRVYYLPYGQHTATNAFKHCKRVMLMGLNFIPKAAGLAASGAALDLDLISQLPTEGQAKAMQLGMLMDTTLQALLRGNARVSVGDDCGEMEAVIPQTKQTGIPLTGYRRMFPGVKIIGDTVLMPPKPLKGRLKELDNIVVRRLEAGEQEMTNQSLYDELEAQLRQAGRPARVASPYSPGWTTAPATTGSNDGTASRRVRLVTTVINSLYW